MTTRVVNEPSGPPTIDAPEKKPPQGIKLIAMNLDSEEERDLLYNQRIVCGWGKEHIPKWRRAMARDERTMFWITIPLSYRQADLPTFYRSDGAKDEEILPIGQVAIDTLDDPQGDLLPDPTCVAPDGSVLSISTLFVLPAFQSFGVGAWTMDAVETLAQKEPYGRVNCRAVTITTLAGRYFDGPDDPDGKGRWARFGLVPPKRSNMAWYEKRGYKTFKEEVRYWNNMPNGERVNWYGAFMRKELPAPDEKI